MAKKKTATPEATAPEPSAAEPAKPGEGLLARYTELRPSTLNPRRSFDADALKELAESIAVRGVLQNLTVRRKFGTEDGFEIVAGERRWRAIGLLVDAGRWDGGETNVPVVCHTDLDDGSALAIALLENVQRKDIDPVEEGHAFARLRGIDPARWSTESIAAAIGKTQRHVQKRIQLVERLAEPVQKALSKGEINLEQAKLLALGPAAAQAQHLKSMSRQDWARSPEQIRRAMTEKLIPVGAAAFDRSLYQGEIVEDESEGESYFADVAQFRQLQDAAIEARRAKLLEDWPWVDVLGESHNRYQYRQVGKSHKKAGAIIFFDHNEKMQVQGGVLRPKDAEAEERATVARATGKKPKKKKPEDVRWLTQGQILEVKRAKTLALRRALVDSPKAALAVAILGMLGAGEIDITISGEFRSRAQGLGIETPDEDLARRKERLAPVLEQLDKKRERDELLEGHGGIYDDDTARVFVALLALETEALLAILAAAIAPRVGCWLAHAGGDDAFAVALAQATGAYERLDGLWKPDEKYFQAYRRDTLHALACANTLADGFAKLKKSEQVKLLAKQTFWTWRHFAELQFLDDDGLRKAMEGPAPAAPLAQVFAESAPRDAGAPLACRHCGAIALRKHKKGCVLAAEGKVSAASCGPDPGDEPPPADSLSPFDTPTEAGKAMAEALGLNEQLPEDFPEIADGEPEGDALEDAAQ